MGSHRFEVEAVLSGIGGRDERHVFVRSLEHGAFSVPGTLDGKPLRSSLDMPRALHPDGSIRLDLFVVQLVLPEHTDHFVEGQEVLLEWKDDLDHPRTVADPVGEDGWVVERRAPVDRGGDSPIHTAIDGVLERIVARRPVAEVMEAAIGACELRRPHAVWAELRSLPFADDVDRSTRWLQGVLAEEPPPAAVNGLWFGINNPTDGPTEADVRSSFYVAGSTTWPGREWAVDCTWWPLAGDSASPVMAELHRRTAAAGDDDIAHFGDSFLTLAFTGTTVVHVVEALGPASLLGAAPARGIEFGHDDGDRFEIGRLEPGGATWGTDLRSR